MSVAKSILGFNAGLIDRSCPDAAEVFFDPGRFAWIARLEAQWREIRAELDGLLLQREAIPAFHEVSKRQRPLSDERWKTFFFHIYGHAVPESARLCPLTAEALRGIPHMTTAMFSILEPGKHIPAHVGPHKGVLRYHLGLKVPAEDVRCAIRVGDQVRWWREGGSLVFDDTYEHEAWNRTDEVRVVLFVDFIRPMPPGLFLFNRLLMSVLKNAADDVKEVRDKSREFLSRIPRTATRPVEPAGPPEATS